MTNWGLKRKFIIFILGAVYLPLISLSIFTQTIGQAKRAEMVKAMAAKDNSSEIIITQSLLNYIHWVMTDSANDVSGIELQDYLSNTKSYDNLKNDPKFNILLDKEIKEIVRHFPTEGPAYYSFEIFLPDGTSLLQVNRKLLAGGKLSSEILIKKFPKSSLPEEEIKEFFNTYLPGSIKVGKFSLDPIKNYVLLTGTKSVLEFKKSKLIIDVDFLLTAPGTMYDVIYDETDKGKDGTFYFDHKGDLLFPPIGKKAPKNVMKSLVPNAPESFFSNPTSIYEDEDGNLYYKGEAKSKLEGLEKIVVMNFYPKSMIMGPLKVFINIFLVIILLFAVISIPLIYQFIKSYISPLENILNKLRRSSSLSQKASDDLDLTSTELAEASLENSSGMDNILESMEKINQSQIDIKEAIGNATDIHEENILVANQSQTGNKELRQSMDEMAEAAGNIGTITDIIEDISFQTNLLSLNASVEAARAGEQGKGFGVVAGSIRELSGKTSASAKEISELILTAIKKSKWGSQLAKQNSEVVSKIMTNFIKTADNIKLVTESLNEQSESVAPLNEGIQQINQISKVSAQKAIACSKISVDLGQATQEMDQIINNLGKILEGKED